MSDSVSRCPWCGTDPLYVSYHDAEWGVPVHDDRRHFELLVLEAAQAGLSWFTVLRKRERYREVFAGLDPQAVARFTETDAARLLLDAGIIRNRLKITSSIHNAARVLEIQAAFGSFDRYLWGFVDGRTVVNHWRTVEEIPPATDLSDRLSKDLKKRGFRSVGSTVIYAHLQAAGLVNDHLVNCFRHGACGG